jgi:hypothetical protein
MRVVEASLKCFRRPVVWLAVGLLVLNDHYLKGAFPSWWTGKLSDVAGLFFFPFIVTAVFGILLLPFGRTRIRAEQVGRFAFILVGLWFALMKLSPAFNGLTTSFWEWLVGGPVFIVMDGTDLLAMPVLFLAWRLWLGQLEGGGKQVHQQSLVWDWRVWVVSGTAVLAAAASGCERYYYGHITQVVEYNGSIYAHSDVERFDGEREQIYGRYNVTTNRWEELDHVPQAILDGFAEEVSLPKTECVSDDSSQCYRIEGDDKVYASTDGGESWDVVWRIPAGRRFFMERGAVRGTLSCRDNKVDMGPNDIVVFGKSFNYRVVAAFGNEGVIMRHQDGSWERQGLLDAWPTPFIGGDLLDVLSKTFFEYLGLFVLVFIYFGGQMIFFLKTRRIDWSLIVSIFVLLLVGIVDIYFWMLGIIPYYWLMMFILVGAAVVTIRWSFRRNLQLLADSREEGGLLDGM